jgi:simple sugar transport system substrate-binding protein
MTYAICQVWLMEMPSAERVAAKRNSGRNPSEEETMVTKLTCYSMALSCLVVLAVGPDVAAQAQPSNDVGGASGKTIMFITNAEPGDSFWAPVEKGAEDAAAKFGLKLTYEPAPTLNNEIALIDAAVAKHVSGIMIQGQDPQAEAAPLKAAEAQGIPVVIVSAGLTNFAEMGALTGVGEGNELGGAAAGTKFNSLGVKRVLCVIHEQNNIALEQRCDGLKQTFKGKVTNMYVHGTGDVVGSEAAMQAELAANPSIGGVLTLSPIIGEAALQAISAANGKAAVATFDLDPAMVSGINSGTVAFALDQEPYQEGFLPVVVLYLDLTEGGVSAGGGQPIFTGPIVVTKANLPSFDKLLAAGIGG